MSTKAKPSTLETLRFTLELLKRIPRSRKISAGELHDELAAAGFQRELRTVQRQLDELAQHFEIDRDDRNKPFGYQWKPNAKGLSVPGLNEKESLLLALAEQHLRNLLPVEVMRTMQPFFEQARTNLTPRLDNGASAKHARDWMRKVLVVSTSQPLLPPKIGPEVFDAVSSALYSDNWLEIKYRNAVGLQTETRVKPLGLAQQGTRLYLVCHFEGHQDERSLALNRISEATNTGLPFERPLDFDLERFDAKGGFGFGSGKLMRLELLMEKRTAVHLLESKLSPDQTETLEGDNYRIKATVAESEQLRWWLRGFGNNVQVVSPQGFAKEFRRAGNGEAPLSTR